jgi:hypothetical protein
MLNARPCPPPSDPTLFVIVDTEEEFDWEAPFRRAHTAVTAVRRLNRVQRIFERYGVKPIYVVDFAVASQPDGYLPLRDMAHSGVCDIGAHLHPWVNPPFEEAISGRTTFACNLSADLEYRKTACLVDVIVENFDRRPRVYKAGRYGFGRSSAAMLERLEFDVDVSVNPHMDFTGIEGPSFAAFDASPFFFGTARELLELPCTVGFAGTAPWDRQVRVSIASRRPHCSPTSGQSECCRGSASPTRSCFHRKVIRWRRCGS